MGFIIVAAFSAFTLPLIVITEVAAISETLLPNVPFVSVWNAPSRVCETRYGVHFNLSYFDIVANRGDTFEGSEIVIFYRNKLGLYPWIRDDGDWENGGLPQFADLPRHLTKVADDVNNFIPNSSFTGAAVIDWEQWRPIFDRNNHNAEQRVYIRESENLVRLRHPDWSNEEIENEARREFEKAARTLMEETLDAGRQLRPHGQWGFYGFPDCYNHKPGEENCSNETMIYNDRLQWLFNGSTVILPSVYLHGTGSPDDNWRYVHGHLREAIRVRNKYGGATVPILVYTRYMYPNTASFYTEEDLSSTIKQSAEAGAAGVALWDSSASFESDRQCQDVRHYVEQTLGPFIKNLTTFLYKCSRELCSEHGRCVRTNWQSHQSPQVYKTEIHQYRYEVRDYGSKYNTRDRTTPVMAYYLRTVLLNVHNFINLFFRKWNWSQFGYSRTEENFQHTIYDGYRCQCYTGWWGKRCHQHIKWH